MLSIGEVSKIGKGEGFPEFEEMLLCRHQGAALKVRSRGPGLLAGVGI